MFFDVKYKWKVRTIQESCFASFNKIKKNIFSLLKKYGVSTDGISNEFDRITFYMVLTSYYFQANYINKDCRDYFMNDSLVNYYAHYENGKLAENKFNEESESLINCLILIYCLPYGYSIKDFEIFNNIETMRKGRHRRNLTNLFLFYIKIALLLIDGFTLNGFSFEMVSEIEIEFMRGQLLEELIQKIYSELEKLIEEYKDTKIKIKMIKKYKYNQLQEKEFEKIKLFEEKD